jgi:hypothetical protein
VGPGPCIPLVVDELGICRLGGRAAMGHACDATTLPERHRPDLHRKAPAVIIATGTHNSGTWR